MDSPTSSASEHFHFFDPDIRTEVTIHLVEYRNLIHEHWVNFESNQYPWLELKRCEKYDYMVKTMSDYYNSYLELLREYYRGDQDLIEIALRKLIIGNTNNAYFYSPNTLFDNLIYHKSYMFTWRPSSIIDYKNKIDDFFKGYEILLLNYGNLKHEMEFEKDSKEQESRSFEPEL